MVSLEKSKLIRLNSDGSNADVFQTKRSSIKFGTSVLCDYIINNELNQYPELLYEISSDTFSRVRTFCKNSHSKEFSWHRLLLTVFFIFCFFHGAY